MADLLSLTQLRIGKQFDLMNRILHGLQVIGEGVRPLCILSPKGSFSSRTCTQRVCDSKHEVPSKIAGEGIAVTPDGRESGGFGAGLSR